MSLDVGRLALVRGSNHPGKGFSAMEAVAFAAGEAWSERPRCASQAITEWMIAWNDGLDDAARQSLRRYIWRLVKSRGTRADERTRQWMAADWLVRWYTPAWLAAAGMRGHASRLTQLPPVRCEGDVVKVWPTVRAASRAARVERDMAWRSAASVVAAHDWGTAGAVWSAIADATWGAAGSAARAVVWSTADPAAPCRVEAPIWDAACDAAADAAGAVAWVAVRDAARSEQAAPMPDSRMGPVQTAAAMIEEATPLVLRREAPAGSNIVVGAVEGRTKPKIDPLTAEWTTLKLPDLPSLTGLTGLVGTDSSAVGSATAVLATTDASSSEGAGADLPAHPSGPATDDGIGHGHHSHGDAGAARSGSGRGCRVCTATSIGGERRDSSPVVETEPMEEPHALAEADDPSETDDMWQLAWETACAVLAPTSAALQATAHDLVDRMLAVTE